MRLEFYPEAGLGRELLEAAVHHETGVGGLGGRFRAEIRRVTGFLRKYPSVH